MDVCGVRRTLPSLAHALRFLLLTGVYHFAESSPAFQTQRALGFSGQSPSQQSEVSTVNGRV